MHNTGQCHCGAVTFEIEGEPLRMAQCHCDACRRMSGTGHASNAFFKTEQVTINGELTTYKFTADSGNTRLRQFCPKCGSRLFTSGTNTPDVIGVHVGTIDNTDWFKPQVVVYHSLRPVWDLVDPAVEKHEKM